MGVGHFLESNFAVGIEEIDAITTDTARPQRCGKFAGDLEHAGGYGRRRQSTEAGPGTPETTALPTGSGAEI